MNYIQEENVFYACGMPIMVAENENGETHVYSSETGKQLSESDLKFGKVFGGGKDCAVKNTSVVMKSGFLYLLAAGGQGGCVEETASVKLDGGMIGGYLYGGGIDDEIGNVNVEINGGAIKYGFFGCGNSLECDNVNLVFSNILCTNVRTGSRNPNAVINGKTNVVMTDGHILDFVVGGGHKDEVSIEVHGGYIEKQIVKSFEGTLNLSIYENIFMPNGVGASFPMLPADVEVKYLPPVPRKQREDFVGDDSGFFDKSDDEGNLVFRFFELRHPDVPRSVTPFPTPFVGDCFLIDFPDGRNMLVDTGSGYNMPEIKDGFERLGVERIDVLVITHPHGDHMANAKEIIENYDVQEIWIPDINAQPSLEAEKARLVEYYEILDEAKNKGKKVLPVADGDTFGFGGAEILVVNPVRTQEPAVDMNENSVAFKVTFKENSATLCGDISDKSEKRLSAKYGENLKTDFLKVAHHGIVYQSYYQFIDFCNPKFGVVPSMRDDGVFLKTTKYSLEHVNGFDTDKLYIAGRYGKIKVVMNGNEKDIKIITQYK